MDVTVHTPTPKLATSIDFYERLGFHGLDSSTAQQASVRMRAGGLVVEINPDRFARAGLRLTKPTWALEIEALRTLTTVIELDAGHGVVDPSGVWIYLTEGHGGETPVVEGQSLLGNFSGVSLETADLAASIELWRVLGFPAEEAPNGGEPAADRSWVTGTSASGFPVTWMRPRMCPHLFFNPSLTFFNSGNNLAVIEALRAAGVEPTEEITLFNDAGIVDNVIVRDPGGYGFFVFND